MPKSISIQPVYTAPQNTNYNASLILPRLYSNVFCVARKASGKSTVLYNLIHTIADKKTKVLFFVPTLTHDGTWIRCCEELTRRKIPWQDLNDIVDYDGNQTLDIAVTQLIRQNEETDSKQQDEENPFPNLFQEVEQKSRKKKRDKPRKSPDYLFVIDDCSHNLRHPSVAKLLKIHRHIKSTALISSQSIKDLHPNAISQIDTCLIFKGFDEPTMEHLHRKLDISLPFNDFYDMYHDVSNRSRYSFLTVQNRTNQYRHCFDKRDIQI